MSVKTIDIKEKVKKAKPTLLFYLIAWTIIIILKTSYTLPEGAHFVSIHVLAAVGLIFISAFLGFKNAMSSDKSNNFIVLLHTIAILITMVFLTV